MPIQVFCPFFSIGLFVFFLLIDWNMYILNIRALLVENIFSHSMTCCLYLSRWEGQRQQVFTASEFLCLLLGCLREFAQPSWAVAAISDAT